MNDVTHPQPQPQPLGVYWQQQVDAWKLSGLSQAEFCKVNELLYHRFVYWRGKFEGISSKPQVNQSRGGFAAVSVRHDVDRGLTLSLPNGLVVRGICSENLSVVRQLLDQL
jgi:hypothetical protein